MKVLISEEDNYPTYNMNRYTDNKWSATIIEVPEEQVLYWERITNEYEKVQKEMHTELMKKIQM